MSAAKNRGRESVTITIEGGFTLPRIDALRKEILDGLRSAERISLNLDKTTEVDVSAFQLICAAHKWSMELHKEITVFSKVPQCFKDTAVRGGYPRSIGCTRQADVKCLWSEVAGE